MARAADWMRGAVERLRAGHAARGAGLPARGFSNFGGADTGRVAADTPAPPEPATDPFAQTRRLEGLHQQYMRELGDNQTLIAARRAARDAQRFPAMLPAAENIFDNIETLRRWYDTERRMPLVPLVPLVPLMPWCPWCP